MLPPCERPCIVERPRDDADRTLHRRFVERPRRRLHAAEPIDPPSRPLGRPCEFARNARWSHCSCAARSVSR